MDRLTDRDELLAFLAKGHRAPEDHRLGLEYELFVIDETGNPVPYSGPGGVEEMLKRLSAMTGWEPISEAGRLLGLRAEDGRSVTLEPGSQIEFNTSPCATLDEVHGQLQGWLDLLQALAVEYPVQFLGLGAQPLASPDEIERIPKGRYGIMEPYLREAGELGVWMMKATCGMQVNFDHRDHDDAMRKLRVALALAPVFSALFANSPLRAREVAGYATWRGHVWTKTDPTRCGLVERCLVPGATFSDYVDWVLEAPMLFIQRGEALLDMRGFTFEDHMATSGATVEDWELHLSTVFPEARFRPHLELRSVDTGCPELAMALTALVKGTFYDEAALAAAEALVEYESPAEVRYLWRDAHHRGLAAPVPGGGTLLDLARKLVAGAALAEDERKWLAPLERILEAGESKAETMRTRLQDPILGAPTDLVLDAVCVP